LSRSDHETVHLSCERQCPLDDSTADHLPIQTAHPHDNRRPIAPLSKHCQKPLNRKLSHKLPAIDQR
jgi:hypothetical protein